MKIPPCKTVARILLAGIVIMLCPVAHASYSALAVEGDVTIGTGKSQKQLSAGQKIPNGATITTGKDGQAILQWLDTFDLYEVTPETKIKVSGKKILGGDGKKMLETE